MQVIQQFKKHTTSNKNHKSLINRDVNNHTFRFIKHTHKSFNKNLYNLKAKFNRFKFTNYIKNTRRLTSVGLSSSFLLVLLILAICIPLYKDELNTKATTGTSNQATTSLAITTASNVASLDLLANNSSGTVATNDNALSFNVFTTNYTGYTLSIASPDNTTYNDGKLTNEIDNNCKSTGTCPVLNTISSASSSITTNGTWGYRPSKLNSSANSNYLPSPTTTGTTIDITTSANGATTSSASSNATNYTIGLAAKANNTQAAGTYTNTYVLQAVGNPITYAITYSDNSGDSSVSNMPTSATTGSTNSANIILSNANPTRTGYMFSGWCSVATTNSGTACSGTTYAKSGIYSINQNTINTATLYALWTANTYSLIINFADAKTSSVKICVVEGNCSGDDLKGTISTSGDSVSGLAYNASYYLYPIFSSNYELDSWSNTGSYGVLSSINVANPTFTMGAGDGAVTIASQIIHYAIGYDSNGGTGAIADQTIEGGSNITLADNAFTRTDYYFKGWATSSSATSPEYRPSQSITPTGNMTLYAVWGSSANANLYDAVASLTRGNQTNDTNATTGIKTNPTKATSGVWTYNSSVFGTASDASTSNPIYYYRGILDTDLDGTSSTYGSNGNSMNYPNYVKLGDMCWRIVRTTGSGGVKMIYNGSYSGGTTANSCANATTNTQLTTQAFGLKGNSAQSTWYYNINRVGYTFNNTQSLQDSTTSTSVDTVFGSDSSPSTNNERSNIKKYIEDTWYANNMTSWTSKLEASAGYCNDRSVFSNDTGTTALTTIPPYATSSATAYFGAYIRNSSFAKAPSLNCPRSTVDLYRYVSGSTGVSNQLKYPTALLTADEASFAGAGGSGSSYNSYLHSGSSFWLLSPDYRHPSGDAFEYSLYSSSGLVNFNVSLTFGVRPVISLISGTKISSGSGTATSPWVIPEPKSMQSFSSTDFANMAVGETTSLIDKRTGISYTVKMISLKNTKTLWMTSNLQLPGGTTLTTADSNVKTDYTLPSSSWSSTQDDYCIPRMKKSGSWYYYNWPAATARTNSTSNTSTCSNDSSNSAGDICPLGWRLPNSSEAENGTWRSDLKTNGSLSKVDGFYHSGYIYNTYSFGYFWTSGRNSGPYGVSLVFDGSTVELYNYDKDRGFSVRCLRTS